MGYLLLVFAGLALLGGHLPNQLALVAIHIALFLLVLLVFPRGRRSRRPVLRFLADWYPVPCYIVMYTTANLSNTIVFRGTFDDIFRGLDRDIFGVEPSFWLARTYGSPLLHEIVHGLYFSYYLLIPGVGLFFYFSGRARIGFQRYLFAVCFTFYVSYVVFIAFPVHGPQLERGDDFAGGVFFVPIMDFIYAHAETGGAAFPSSHVAVALVCLLFARRHSWALFLCCLPSVLGLFVATVYCRYHYAVDSLAGLLWGALLYGLGNWIFSRLKGPAPSIR
jgi:hypothetical protein